VQNRVLAEYIAKGRAKEQLYGRQRQSPTHDFGGVEFTRQGSASAPANFFVTISRDMQYMYEWTFKLILQDFQATSSGGSSSVSLNVSQLPDHNIPDHSIADHTHAPIAIPGEPHGPLNIAQGNHTHAVQTHPALTHPLQVINPATHNHTTVQGAVNVPTSPEGLEVFVEGYNITPFLIAQFPPTATGGFPAPINNWGTGVYPNVTLDAFNLRDAAIALGNPAKDKILSAGYKNIQIKTNPTTPGNLGLFNATIVMYCQYSMITR
jgi:hypothetical protein